MHPIAFTPVDDRLIVGFSGYFTMNDFINHPLSFLYWYAPDTDTWSMFGSSESTGVDGKVLALAPVGEHETYAGGEFRFAGTVPAGGVAHFKDGQWYPLGGGTDANVDALVLHEDGSLYVGGTFSTVTQAPA